MELKGVAFKKLYFPCQIKIEVEQKDEQKWELRYSESFKEIPEEAILFTMEVARRLGVTPTREDKTISYKVEGSKEAIASIISGEFLAISTFGQVTLTELLALAALGLPTLQKDLKKFGLKELSGESHVQV